MTAHSPLMLVNGAWQDTVSALDRGLLFGDGLFETIAVQAGKPRYWQAHLDRLRQGCSRLGIDMVDEDVLEREAGMLCGSGTQAVLKIIITRGAGGRGYGMPAASVPTRVLQLHPWPDYPASNSQHGVRVRVCSTRMGHNPVLAGIKHLNRLEQVLARAEWDDAAIAEGLLLDQQERLIEGTMSNVFLVIDKVLVTPELDQCGVAGVTRARLLELAHAAGILTDSRDVTASELSGAREIFVCNSIIGIWPVRDVDGQAYPPGETTRQLQELLQADAGA